MFTPNTDNLASTPALHFTIGSTIDTTATGAPEATSLAYYSTESWPNSLLRRSLSAITVTSVQPSSVMDSRTSLTSSLPSPTLFPRVDAGGTTNHLNVQIVAPAISVGVIWLASAILGLRWIWIRCKDRKLHTIQDEDASESGLRQNPSIRSMHRDNSARSNSSPNAAMLNSKSDCRSALNGDIPSRPGITPSNRLQAHDESSPITVIDSRDRNVGLVHNFPAEVVYTHAPRPLPIPPVYITAPPKNPHSSYSYSRSRSRSLTRSISRLRSRLHPRQEQDGGVRLAGGPFSSANQEFENAESDIATISTLPPPYQVYQSDERRAVL